MSSRPSGNSGRETPGNFPANAGNKPAERFPAGNQPGANNRPGLSERPGNNDRLGPDNKPGLNNRPDSLPGMSNRFPNSNDRLPANGNRLPNNAANVQDRRNDLQSTFQNRSNWQNNHVGDNNFNFNNGFNPNNYHNNWYHGNNYGGWWNHGWDDHPGWMAFGMTAWGVNRMAYGFGLAAYSNPYYSGASNAIYNYSQPIIQQPVAMSPSSAGGATPTPGPPQASQTAFDQARSDFYSGNYEAALNNVNLALKDNANDAVIHEFRALTLFALGRFREAASTIHPVLAVGPGWDWATLVSLYPAVNVYTDQLRKLEEFTRANPKSADAQFLLAYHYLTCEHKEAAHKIFQKVLALQPDDSVAAEYIRLTETTSDNSTKPTPQPPQAANIPDDKALTEKDLIGKWKSPSAKGTSFALELTEKGEFTWSYTQGQSTQSVKGVYALDQNQLAMQPDTGGTMLANLSKTGTGFHFAMDGAPDKDPGIDFSH